MDRRRNRNSFLSMVAYNRSALIAVIFFLFGFQIATVWFNFSRFQDVNRDDVIKSNANSPAKQHLVFNGSEVNYIKNLLRSINDSSVQTLFNTMNISNEIKRGTTEVPQLPKCHNEKQQLETGTLIWQPKPLRYLVAFCSGGQLSNRFACIRQSMVDAALLNRTLILPTSGLDYNFEDLLDLDAIKECFGLNVIITLDEYAKEINKQVRISRFICHVHVYQTEEVCKNLANKFKQIYNLTFGKEEIAKRRTPSGWFKYPSSDFIKKFNSDHHVLAFANMMGVGGRELKFDDLKPFAVRNTCHGFLQPSKIIRETAVGFIDSFLGKHYMAVHLRRGDFFNHCLKGSAKERSVPCLLPMPQIANCLAEKLKLHFNVKALFIATNADDMEFDILQSVLNSQAKGIPIIRLSSAENKYWAEPLHKKNLENDAAVLSLVDKTICAHSMIFFSTPGSTFSNDIHRLRSWWKGENKSCDGYICPPEEQPDIIPLDP